MLTSATPILPSRNLPKTLDFYKRLGFHLVGRTSDEYAIMRRDESEIHFFAQPDLDPKLNRSGCYLLVHDVDALGAELAANRIEMVHDAEDKPWRMRELKLVDPDGNVLRFGARLKVVS